MAIRVEVYTPPRASGQVGVPQIRFPARRSWPPKRNSCSWASPGRVWATRRDPAETLSFAVDDIVFALADGEPNAPVHAAWHHVVLHAGPYALEGDLATMPGFDPGRSLARPSGDFVLLRDVRLSLARAA